MNLLKQTIDNELSNMKVSGNLALHIESKAKRRLKNKVKKNYIKAACIMLGFIISGMTVYATGNYIYEKLMVNNEQLPELSAMEVKNVNIVKADKNEAGDYEKQIDGYEDLQNELGISLLNTSLSDNNDVMLIKYKSDHKNWIMVKITAFIKGDVKNMLKVENENIYTYEKGLEFGSPINLELDIITSEEQKRIGWERDYLGYYEFVESYESSQGIKINLLKDMVENESVFVSSKYMPEYKAVFVSDGIRYILSGRVSLEKMKEIVDSLQ